MAPAEAHLEDAQRAVEDHVGQAGGQRAHEEVVAAPALDGEAQGADAAAVVGEGGVEEVGEGGVVADQQQGEGV